MMIRYLDPKGNTGNPDIHTLHSTNYYLQLLLWTLDD